MPLVVGQIIYSSFPNIGYHTFANSEIPALVQSAFVENIVYEYWDVYEPPPQGYKAGFIHQLDIEQTLFGWLFNDGVDDYGRLHTPYCLGYYLRGTLEPARIDRILDCVCKGPVRLISRQAIPEQIETIEIPTNYEPATSGVVLTEAQFVHVQQQVQQQQLLQQLFSTSSAQTTESLVTDAPSGLEQQPVPEPQISVVAAQSQTLSRSKNSVPVAGPTVGHSPGQRSRQGKAAQRAELASQIIAILDETL